jgi:hypothetical protein
MATQTQDEPQTDAWAGWRNRIAAARKRIEDVVQLWQDNVDARRGKLEETDSSTTRVSVNQDWPLTKAKVAQLYSQTPEIRLSPRDQAAQQAVAVFGRELNAAIAEATVGMTVEEVLADVINASGIGGAIVSCERRTAPTEVPAIDPSTVPPGMAVPMMVVDAPTDVLHKVERISPADLLVPSDFTGSNYDQSRWLGHRGRMTWPQATRSLGLTEQQKEDVLGSDKRAGSTTNSLNTDTTKFRDSDVVTFTEVFYWRHFYHADETSFKAIQRLVFVDGLAAPVVDEPYAGQQRGPSGAVFGVTKLPIRILTLTYISDDCLPPSDSSVSRYQVTELEQSRDAMVQQRKHSVPIRWFDTNRVSQGTKSLLERGDFQGFIPTNGPGDRAIGEVARSSFPPENFSFDSVIKSDLSEIWQVGSNQAGAFAATSKSASEARIVQQNFQTRVGQERDKVTRFVLGVAEVLAGHLALYGTFAVPDELGVQREALATSFTYSVRVDSTVRLDAEQRIEQLQRALNLTAQSGFVNPQPIIAEIIELSGLDPAKVVVDPQPKAPEPVKVSISNAMDLRDPVFLAALMRTGQAPGPEDLDAALKLLAAAGMGAVAAPPQPMENGIPREVETPGITFPNWDSAPRIDRRAEDGGA